jgi:hypothetical protein
MPYTSTSLEDRSKRRRWECGYRDVAVLAPRRTCPSSPRGPQLWCVGDRFGEA